MCTCVCVCVWLTLFNMKYKYFLSCTFKIELCNRKYEISEVERK